MNGVFDASAGTGKTWQVTELYAALVLGREHPTLGRISEHPVPPENILLMTFTDNAAAELRQKVSEKLLGAEDNADADPSDLARSVLRRLPAANISTIHAFCAGVLREHALEQGFSPVFQTLEDEARDELLDETLKAELFQTLETDPDFRNFCSGLSVLNGEYSVLNTIRMLLDRASSRGLDLVSVESLLPEPMQTVGKDDFVRIHDELASHDLPTMASVALDALKLFLADFPDIGKLEEVKKFGQAKKVKHLSDELAELKDRFITETLYAENIEPFRAFARCLSRCADGFAKAKRARDGVDFGDQLLMARDLLKSGSVDAPKFDWIIVDEVQDTSRVQCDVVQALWGAQTHLVICGDPKQSIYAWRSADPDVMPDLVRLISERDGAASVALTESYRSKDRVIDAVNQLFAGLYGPSYSALKPRGVLEGEKPCVEFLEADDEEQSCEQEMEAVARRIRLLVDGDDAWRPRYGHNGEAFAEGVPVRYGDILILLKRSTHQAALEKALRDAGIPCASGGKGRALFEQQEVRDLLLLLQAICQPQNDLALVGFLRSPFVNLPDDDLVRLGWDGNTFDRAVLRRQFLETERAGMLLRLREASATRSASQLVREAVRETAFDASLAGQPGGEQKLANFKKALDWIREVERGGQMLIGDVVRRFEKALQTPPRSGAAEAMLPDPDQDAVTIMTVHGAKGLTKRVCFVPDISFRDQADKGFAVFSKDSLELKRTDLDGRDIKSPGWDAARDADKQVRQQESLNVFYVAMTRARDLVVLSGAGTQKSDGWLKLAEGFLENAPLELLCKRTFSDIPSAIENSLPATDHSLPVVFQPLQIPKSPERKPVTSLVEHLKPNAPSATPSSDRRAFGTLGHVALEALAKTRWEGDIPDMVKRIAPEFGQADELIEKLEAARRVLAEVTADADELRAEFPFVMQRDDVILDGTMDLLARFSTQWKIFDYKFSDEVPEVALETYGPQLAAYQEAVEALYPGEPVSAALILIGKTIQMVDRS